MADRTSAELFGRIFRKLAEEAESAPINVFDFARWVYDQTGEYDFMPYQMDADEALKALDLWAPCSCKWRRCVMPRSATTLDHH